jgi:hypothetical protein
LQYLITFVKFLLNTANLKGIQHGCNLLGTSEGLLSAEFDDGFCLIMSISGKSYLTLDCDSSCDSRVGEWLLPREGGQSSSTGGTMLWEEPHLPGKSLLIKKYWVGKSHWINH